MAGGHDRTIPPGIPDAGAFPAGLIEFVIEEITETQTSTGKYAEEVLFRAVAPPAVEGMPKTETFTIGTDDDPDAEDPITMKKSFGSRMLKTMSGRAGVPWEGSRNECVNALIGRHVLGEIRHQIEPDKNKDGTDNPYAGRIRDRIGGWYEVGKRAPCIKEDDATDSAPATVTAAAPRAVATPRPAAPPPTRPAAVARPR